MVEYVWVDVSVVVKDVSDGVRLGGVRLGGVGLGGDIRGRFRYGQVFHYVRPFLDVRSFRVVRVDPVDPVDPVVRVDLGPRCPRCPRLPVIPR